MDTLLTWLIAGSILGFFMIRYWLANKRSEAKARESAERGAMFSDGPKAQHPKIHRDACIGCGGCVSVCPEGDVLAIIDGKATIVNGHKCIGHGLCAEECPVGAIEMVMAKPSAGADLPVINPEFETSVENLFIVGELGGLALIKNAVNQGRDCMDVIAQRLAGKGMGFYRREPLRRNHRGCRSRRNQRFPSSRRTRPRCADAGARERGWDGLEISATEARDDESG